MTIGSHVSMTGGLLGAVEEALSYGANTFMVYTGAPQNTIRKSLDKLKIEEGKALMAKNGITEFVVHAPYIVNLATYNDEKYEHAIEFFGTEIERTAAFGAKYIVLHPGAYTDKTLEYGIERIASALNRIITSDTKPIVCLETMAGKGTEIGKTFDELAKIIDKIELKDKVGVCFDTCHTHDSGMDIVNDFQGVMKNFDDTIGLDKLKVFHINGSLNVRGAKKDRHANIGAKSDNPKGEDKIGFDAIYNIANSKYAENKPLILETPWLDKENNLYKQEIEALRGKRVI